MIDPKLLTKETGFMDGVVVEVVWNVRAYGRTEFWYFETVRGYSKDTCKNVDSIRPLTGPMSIWNHAPEWATWYIDWGDSIQWGRNPENIGSGTPVYRPWWAITQKERE